MKEDEKTFEEWKDDLETRASVHSVSISANLPLILGLLGALYIILDR